MKYITVSILSLFIAACTPEPEVDIPAEERKLVMNSLFNETGKWKVKLSMSQPYFSEDPFRPVISGTVRIMEEDQPLITLAYEGNGAYTGQSSLLIPGKKYTLEATADGKTVTASDHLPASVGVSDITIQQDQTVTGNNGTLYQDQSTVSFSINDTAGENYYHIFVTLPSGSSVQFRSNSTLLDNLDHTRGFLLSDKNIQGQSIDFKVYFNGSNEIARVHIRSVSQDYYNYILSTSISLHADIDYDLLPVSIFSNVENGYGLFAAYSEQIIEVE